MTLDCNTHKVYQKSGNIYIHDLNNNRTDVIKVSQDIFMANNNDTKINSSNKNAQEKLLSKIESIILTTTNSLNNEVSIGALSQEYMKKYNKPLSKTIKGNKLGSSIIKFLKTNCSERINIKQKNDVYYLSLK